MSYWPSGAAAKARNLPSGDQNGSPVVGSDSAVSCVGRWPLASDTQISAYPDRKDMNEIFCPSGEYCGLTFILNEEITSCGLEVWLSFRSSFQIPASSRMRAKAITPPLDAEGCR